MSEEIQKTADDVLKGAEKRPLLTTLQVFLKTFGTPKEEQLVALTADGMIKPSEIKEYLAGVMNPEEIRKYTEAAKTEAQATGVKPAATQMYKPAGNFTGTTSQEGISGEKPVPTSPRTTQKPGS